MFATVLLTPVVLCPLTPLDLVPLMHYMGVVASFLSGGTGETSWPWQTLRWQPLLVLLV